jgi:hypothetical protein
VLVEAIKQRMGRLVGDDVVRKTGEHHAARKLAGGSILGRGEVPKQQRGLVAAVVGVGHSQGVGIDTEFWNVVVLPFTLLGESSVGPERPAAKRKLEVLDGGHRDRVGHLLVELRVALGGSVPLLSKEFRAVEINRSVRAATRGIDVHDLDILADRSGFELFPADAVGDLADDRDVESCCEARIEGVATQKPVCWCLRFRRKVLGRRSVGRPGLSLLTEIRDAHVVLVSVGDQMPDAG